MKKFYYLILFALAFQISKAQLTLTKAANEPVIGDIHVVQLWDSTSAIPKATGAGVIWNFSSIVSTTNVFTSNFTTVAVSSPSPASFPSASFAESNSGDYNMCKSTATTYELVGYQSSFGGSNSVIIYTNSAIFAVWPIAMGYTATDTYSGSDVSATVTTIDTGTFNTNAKGTGTLILPGGLTLTNCLQIVTTSTDVFTIAGTGTVTSIQRQYDFYHSSQKFPIISVSYGFAGGSVSYCDITVNNAVLAGIKEQELKSNISVFPNPAKESITISLYNNLSKEIRVQIANLLGETVKMENLRQDGLSETKLNVNDLPQGVYFINIQIGTSTEVKKLVIE